LKRPKPLHAHTHEHRATEKEAKREAQTGRGPLWAARAWAHKNTRKQKIERKNGTTHGTAAKYPLTALANRAAYRCGAWTVP